MEIRSNKETRQKGVTCLHCKFKRAYETAPGYEILFLQIPVKSMKLIHSTTTYSHCPTCLSNDSTLLLGENQTETPERALRQLVLDSLPFSQHNPGMQPPTQGQLSQRGYHLNFLDNKSGPPPGQLSWLVRSDAVDLSPSPLSAKLMPFPLHSPSAGP